MPVPALLLVVAVAAGVTAQGGYYRPGRLLLTAVVAAALAGSLLRHRPTRADAWPAPVACAALGAWALARAAIGGAGYPEAAAAAATLGCLATAVFTLRPLAPAVRERLAEAVAAVGVLVALGAWAGVAWRLPRLAVLVEHRLWRGAATLTYPNAAAAVLAPLALLALALLAARPRSVARGAAAYLLLVGVGAALSRAGVIALAAGLVVLAVLAGARRVARTAAPPLAGAVLALAALAPSFPAGGVPRPALAVAGLLAGAAVAVGAPRVPARLAGAAAAAGALLAAAAIWTQRGSDHLAAILASRGNLASSGRSGAIDAALERVAARPWTGAGPGQGLLLWLTPDGNGQAARYVHNEYLQTLVDLGAVGLALLLVALAALAWTVRRGRRHAHRPGVWAGAAAALTALAVHSAFDFLWHIPVLPLLGGLLVGLAGPATRENPTPPHHKEQ
jgi:hypothetical protein